MFRNLYLVLRHVEHRPPNSNPSIALPLEHPQIPARCLVFLAVAFIDHVIRESHHSGVVRLIDFITAIMEFVNLRVLTEIAEAVEERLAPVRPTLKARKYHDHFRMQHWSKIVDAAVEPSLVDSTHDRGNTLARGFLAHVSVASLARVGPGYADIMMS